MLLSQDWINTHFYLTPRSPFLYSVTDNNLLPYGDNLVIGDIFLFHYKHPASDVLGELTVIGKGRVLFFLLLFLLRID